jgi:UDP:flavonoid glycosyltransferase YjiC (YdhE family)
VLKQVNWVLANWGQPPLGRIGQLFADVDEQFLATLPELDHFPGRPRTGYWGPVLSSGGEAPDWPEGGGKKVFVYLKATPDAEDVLATLKRAGCPTVAFVEGLAPSVRKRVEAPNVRLAPRRVDVARAARECDLAVVNGGHGVTAEMLLAGKPLVVVPQVLEQQQTARAVERLGAGAVAAARDPDSIVSALDSALRDRRRQADAAGRFAARYAAFDGARQRVAMFDRAGELLAGAEAAQSAAPALADA